MFFQRVLLYNRVLNLRKSIFRNPGESLSLLYLKESVKLTQLNYSGFYYFLEHRGKWMHAGKKTLTLCGISYIQLAVK